MPWEVSDVSKHKKGLTPTQKKKWVEIANGVLKDCQAKGGKDCDGKAIRIANSKFTEEFTMPQITMKTEKIPKGALRFVDINCQAHAEMADDGAGNNIPKLRMTGYSGKIIKDHFWWGDLAMDLKGVKFEGSKFPILENHYTDRKIAFHKGKPVVDESGLHVNSDKTQFVSTKESEEFQRLSQEGFPYQSSIHAKPLKIKRLMEGEEHEVNGYKMKGPNATIWLEWMFKEMSVCVFGWDTKTQAEAFSKEVTEEISFDEEGGGQSVNLGTETLNQKSLDEGGGDKTMPFDIEKFKEENSEAFNQIVQIGVDKAEALFAKERNKLTGMIEGQTVLLQDQGKQIAKLEKNDILRSEKELAILSLTVFNSKLAESAIPNRLWEKVRNMVDVNDFVKDDVLDSTAFSVAIDEEIKDWENRGVKTSVLGGGGSLSRDIDEPEEKEKVALAAENKTIVNTLLRLAGQPQKSVAA